MDLLFLTTGDISHPMSDASSDRLMEWWLLTRERGR